MDTKSWEADQKLSLQTTNGERRFQLIERLGGGKTSVVWLARTMQDDDTPTGFDNSAKKVALKVLHTDSESQWREAFEDEIAVLRALEGKALDAVPQLFDVSKQNASPAFLTMEYVAFPSAQELAKPEYQLNELVQEMVKAVDSLHYQASLLQSRTSSLNDVAQIQEQLTTVIKNSGAIQQSLPTLQTATKEWDEANKGLEEWEVMQIGFQVCQVLQALHEMGRSYKDFQLQNIHWNREKKQVKIIDWNVVTKPGSINIQGNTGLELIKKDLTTLAQNLFYLRTLVMPPESASADLLRHYGGELWQRSSYLFKLVLEKALHPQAGTRFKWAYKAPGGTEESLGEILRQVSDWLSMNATKLVSAAEEREPRDDWVLGLCQFAEARLGKNNDLADENLLKRIEELRKMVQTEGSDLRTIEYLVTAKSYSDALSSLNALSEKSLMHHRWEYILTEMSNENAHSLLDKGGAVQLLLRGMGELEAKQWGAAQTTFQALDGMADAGINFPKSLMIDAEVGVKLQQVEWEFARLQALLPRYSGQPFLAGPGQKILDLLTAVQNELGLSTTNGGSHPYAQEILATWTEHGTWKKETQAVVDNANSGYAKANTVVSDINNAIQEKGRIGLLERGLMELPGNDVILYNQIEWVKKQLKDGKPEVALPVLELCLRYAGSSVYFGELWRYRHLAADWLQLQKCVGTNPRLATMFVSRLVESVGKDDMIKRKIFEELATKKPSSRQINTAAVAQGNEVQ